MNLKVWFKVSESTVGKVRKLAEDVEALRAEEAEEKKVKIEMMMNDDDVEEGEGKEVGDEWSRLYYVWSLSLFSIVEIWTHMNNHVKKGA